MPYHSRRPAHFKHNAPKPVTFKHKDSKNLEDDRLIGRTETIQRQYDTGRITKKQYEKRLDASRRKHYEHEEPKGCRPNRATVEATHSPYDKKEGLFKKEEHIGNAAIESTETHEHHKKKHHEKESFHDYLRRHPQEKEAYEKRHSKGYLTDGKKKYGYGYYDKKGNFKTRAFTKEEAEEQRKEHGFRHTRYEEVPAKYRHDEASKATVERIEQKKGTLTAEERRELPARDFAEPEKRKYPMENRNHAKAALSRVEHNGTPSEKREVRARVAKKYPGLEKKKSVKVHDISARTLENIDRKIWERHGWNSRGDVNKEEYRRELRAELAKHRGERVTVKTRDKLTDDNYHLLREELER